MVRYMCHLNNTNVNPKEVQALFETFDTEFMLHGHTHRPAFHNHTKDNKNYLRMVLGDWHYQCSCIEYQNQQFRLLTC